MVAGRISLTISIRNIQDFGVPYVSYVQSCCGDGGDLNPLDIFEYIGYTWISLNKVNFSMLYIDWDKHIW